MKVCNSIHLFFKDRNIQSSSDSANAESIKQHYAFFKTLKNKMYIFSGKFNRTKKKKHLQIQTISMWYCPKLIFLAGNWRFLGIGLCYRNLDRLFNCITSIVQACKFCYKFSASLNRRKWSSPAAILKQQKLALTQKQHSHPPGIRQSYFTAVLVPMQANWITLNLAASPSRLISAYSVASQMATWQEKRRAGQKLPASDSPQAKTRQKSLD